MSKAEQLTERPIEPIRPDPPAAEQPSPSQLLQENGRAGWGLSSKLLLATAAFVMLAEVLIFLPSIANFRVNWLNDKLVAAQLASLAAGAYPGGQMPDSLRRELLQTGKSSISRIKT